MSNSQIVHIFLCNCLEKLFYKILPKTFYDFFTLQKFKKKTKKHQIMNLEYIYFWQSYWIPGLHMGRRGSRRKGEGPAGSGQIRSWSEYKKSRLALGSIIINISIIICHLLRGWEAWRGGPERERREELEKSLEPSSRRERQEDPDRSLEPRTLRKAGEGWLHPRVCIWIVQSIRDNTGNPAPTITLNHSLQMGQTRLGEGEITSWRRSSRRMRSHTGWIRKRHITGEGRKSHITAKGRWQLPLQHT